MEMTNELAIEMSLVAGDANMKANGRTEWTSEDAAVAQRYYEQLKPVQKMDETEESE